MRSSWGGGPRRIVRVRGKDGRRAAEGSVYSIIKRNGLNVSYLGAEPRFMPKSSCTS